MGWWVGDEGERRCKVSSFGPPHTSYYVAVTCARLDMLGALICTIIKSPYLCKAMYTKQNKFSDIISWVHQ